MSDHVAIPKRRAAFLKGKARLFMASAGTALPGDLETTTDGTISFHEQTLTLPSGATGGNFTLTHQDETTAALDHDSTAAEIQTALEAVGMTSLGSGQVAVSGAVGGPFTLTFGGSKADAMDIDLLSIADSTTGGTGDASVVWVREPLGYTEGPSKITMTETIVGFGVNEEYADVDHDKSKEEGTAEGTLAEATLRRWDQVSSGVTHAVQAAGAGQSGYETLGFGGADMAEPVQLWIVGRNRDGYDQAWCLWRAVRELSGGPSFERGGKTIVPLKCKLEVDSTQDPGYRLAKAWNLTGPAT